MKNIKVTDAKISSVLAHTIGSYNSLLESLRYSESYRGNRTQDWPSANGDDKVKSFGYIPTRSNEDLVVALVTAHSRLRENYPIGNLTFVDAGCGLCNVMILADAVGFWEVTGIEIDPVTVKIARKIAKRIRRQNKMEVIEGNLVTHKSYNYDCIYTYQPFAYDELAEEMFANLLMNGMKRGAILIARGCKFYKKFKLDLRFEYMEKDSKRAGMDMFIKKFN